MAQIKSKEITQERELFSERLKWALEEAGYEARPTIVQREYNCRSQQAPVTSHAARKWLQGDAVPTQEKIQILSSWLNLSAEWLRFGDEENATKFRDLSEIEKELIQSFRGLKRNQKMHLIALVKTISAEND